ncbi:MAG: site-specific integrase, partial [Phenylobacterium sp.]|uniref:site-specific integrase n=1 Tax=Phenylobacterium sp. TaxID=1871053 RepID=UPI0025F989BB
MDARAALTLWLEHLEQERRLSPRTLAAYGFIGRRYLTFLEGHRGGPLAAGDLGQVSAADIRAWLAVLRQGDAPLSPRSLSQSLSAIRTLHRFLDRRLDIPNPALGLVRGPRVRPSAPRPVSEDQALELLAESALDADLDPWEAARDEAVLTLLYGCGLRISEALSLRRRDAPLGESLRITGKGAKTRMVPVLPRVAQAVEAYLAALPFPLAPDEPLFRARRGGLLSPRHVQAAVQRMRGRLGLPDSATP